MKIKEAIELCKEYGWEVSIGKYFLEQGDERYIMDNDEELLNYAKMLERERQ